MRRRTIDFGIDLGTTNSSIGVWMGDHVRIFRNRRSEITPSAVFIGPDGGPLVGERAKQQLELNSENAYGEFKLQMGTPTAEFAFRDSGRVMTATELSAEVLKELRRAVARETGEEVDAAVVTVPANFELPGVSATVDAARRAGIADCRTIPEPIAAALAYVRSGLVGDGYWLVYDIGGGTFDAALLNTIGGRPQLIEHAGDPGLGGKLIDWDIVTKLMVPQLLDRGFHLPHFRRDNRHWLSAFAKLKHAAEQAKIDLSDGEPSLPEPVHALCRDANGRSVEEFRFELSLDDVKRLAEPYVAKTIKVCRALLASRALVPSDLERVVLVGGPTLAPYLREQLEAELGIPFDRSNVIDPLTVVARGAAAFAAGIEREKPTKCKKDKNCEIEIPPPRTVAVDYQPATGTSRRPEMTIVLNASEKNLLRGATLQLVAQNQPIPWESGRISVPDSQQVTVNALAQAVTNVYRVILRDPQDREIAVEPHTISYTRREMEESILINSFGIGLADGRFERFFRKGDKLKVELEKEFETTADLPAGDAAALPLDVVFYEGENDRAARNKEIGRLRIAAREIRMNLVAGSRVRVRIAIDVYRRVTTAAYCPILDQRWTNVLDPISAPIDLARLNESVTETNRRRQAIEADLAELRQDTAAGAMIERAARALGEIDARGLEGQLSREHDAAGADRDAADRADRHARELHGLFDTAEDALQWPKLVRQANQWADYAQRLITQYAQQQYQAELDPLRAQAARHSQERNKDLLLDTKDALATLCWKIRSGDVNILAQEDLGYLASQIMNMTDPKAAREYLARAQQAIAQNDPHTASSMVSALYGLLPRGSSREPPGLRPVGS